MKKPLEKNVNKREEWIQKVDVFLVEDYLLAKCWLTPEMTKEHYKYAFYVYKKGDLKAVSKSKYTKFDTYQVPLTEGGEYFVKAFAKKIDSVDFRTKTSNPIRKTLISDI